MKNKKIPFLIFIVIFLSAFVSDIMAQITNTPHGILVNVGGEKVEIAVSKTSAFRLSICASGEPKPNASVFIDESNTSSVKFEVVAKKPIYGIKTSFGKLIININTKNWSLIDSEDKVLIQNGTFSSTDTLQTINDLGTNKRIIYGAGNQNTKNLVKQHSYTQAGNGVAGVPYLWSNAGYSSLGITGDDNLPAQWDSKNSTEVVWTFPGKSADLYLWPAKNLYEASEGLISLTGKPKLPPRWVFGYMQSRWGWESRTYTEDAITMFHDHKLPVDAFIYDYEWYTEKHDHELGKQGSPNFPDFEFNTRLFPEPAKQISDYKRKGIKFIGIRKPRIGDSERLNFIRSKGWLKYPDSDQATDSRDMDFSNADLRQWYKTNNKSFIEAGVDAWWNDEGESYYTLYYWWNKAQYELLSETKSNARFFSLNRSYSLGNQRFGYCTWNGDIHPTWDVLKGTAADLLNWSLSGMFYGSCDIGGFFNTPSNELLVRWYQAGVFFPIMRSHSIIGVKPRFPWLWGIDAENAIRKALNLRYQLIPLMYSLGHEAYQTGAPIMRPLVMEFQNDSNVVNLTDEWLLGNGLLVAPVMTPGGVRDVYLPKDTWYNFYTNEVIQGPAQFSVNKALNEIPVYVRAGTILPLGPIVQHTEQDSAGVLEIRVYPGNDGTFTLTEDDGASYNYIKGNVRKTRYTWNDTKKTLSWKVEGYYTGKGVYKTIKCIVGKKTKTIALSKSGKHSFK